jgi:hypothetical protein
LKQSSPAGAGSIAVAERRVGPQSAATNSACWSNFKMQWQEVKVFVELTNKILMGNVDALSSNRLALNVNGTLV